MKNCWAPALQNSLLPTKSLVLLLYTFPRGECGGRLWKALWCATRNEGLVCWWKSFQKMIFSCGHSLEVAISTRENYIMTPSSTSDWHRNKFLKMQAPKSNMRPPGRTILLPECFQNASWGQLAPLLKLHHHLACPSSYSCFLPPTFTSVNPKDTAEYLSCLLLASGSAS